MDLLRTPPGQFANLAGYPFAENYLEIPFEDQQIRMHYVDEGDRGGETVVLLHGEPTWSYLYRTMIPPLVAAGHRVVAPDLVGFGKSDKPSRVRDYTYRRQEQWLRTALFDVLGLRDVTLYAQDWGGLLSLRLVAFEPERFSRVMVANTGLPAGGHDSAFVPGDASRMSVVRSGLVGWKTFARRTPVFPLARVVQMGTETRLPAAVLAGYEAPFPGNRYLVAARAMPSLIPTDPRSPAALRNREAWQRLATFDRPFRTASSDRDPAMGRLGVDARFQRHVTGAAGQRHVTIRGAGHFLQEDQGEQVAEELDAFIAETPRG